MLDTPTDAPITEAEQIDAIRRYEFRNLDIEGELTDLEGLAVALKIVRHGDGIFSDLEHDSPAFQHALFAMVDSVLDQIAKLSRAYRGEPLSGIDPDARSDESDGDGENEAEESVPSRLMELFGNMTDEALAKLCPDDRSRIGELCRRWAERAERGGEGRPCP